MFLPTSRYPISTKFLPGILSWFRLIPAEFHLLPLNGSTFVMEMRRSSLPFNSAISHSVCFLQPGQWRRWTNLHYTTSDLHPPFTGGSSKPLLCFQRLTCESLQRRSRYNMSRTPATALFSLAQYGYLHCRSAPLFPIARTLSRLGQLLHRTNTSIQSPSSLPPTLLHFLLFLITLLLSLSLIFLPPPYPKSFSFFSLLLTLIPPSPLYLTLIPSFSIPYPNYLF